MKHHFTALVASIFAFTVAFASPASAAVVQQAFVKASDAKVSDSFGDSAAASGNTVVVGAAFEDSNALGVDTPQTDKSGAAYAFLRSGGSWTQQAFLKASNVDNNDEFASAVAISGDTIVVGAAREDSSSVGVNSASNESAEDAGAAYVFVRTGGVWTQQAYLKPSLSREGNKFGTAVAIDGDTIVIGAPFEDSGSTGVNGIQDDLTGPGSGAAYVFTRSGGVWTQQAYLKASNTGDGDAFGHSVSVSGGTVAVGARAEDSGIVGVETDNSALTSGAVYVFVRSGGTWAQQAYLKASTPGGSGPGDAFGDNFGFSLCLDGDTLAVGAPMEDSASKGINGDETNNNATQSGAAYVFTRNAGVWSQQAYIKASNTGLQDQFGWAIGLHGNMLVVGAPQEDGSGSGVNPAPNDKRGNSGAAYFFTRSGTTWAQTAYVKAFNPSSQDYFGRTIAAGDSLGIVGAPFESSTQPGINPPGNDDLLQASGAAYFFNVPGAPVRNIQVPAQLAGTGETATFTASFDGAPATGFRWFNGTAAIPDGSTNPLTISPVRLDDAGLYKVQITNSAGSLLSPVAQLAVVDTADEIVPAAENGTLVLNAPVRGTGLSYQWLRNNEELNNGELNRRVSGATSAKLRITKFTGTDSALFRCRVTLGAKTVTSGTRDVRISAPPAIIAAGSLPALITNGAVDWRASDLISQTNSQPQDAATSFSVAKLPRGLRFDPATGRITGRPQVTGLTSVTISITATNVAGSGSVNVTLPFESLPSLATGEFRGLLERNAALNRSVGGAVQLTVSALGGVSGRLFNGPTETGLSGTLDATARSRTVTCNIAIPRKRTTPLTLSFSINGDTGAVDGSISADGQTAGFDGVRCPWSKDIPAAAFSGSYTAALPISVGQSPNPIGSEPDYPQGDGYLVVKVGATGTVSINGRLADGNKVALRTLLGTNGEIPLFLAAYGKAGSAEGWATISTGNRFVDGTLSFFKNPLNGTRSYKQGIPLHNLTAIGGLWTDPAPALVLGITDNGTDNNAQLAFTRAAINVAGLYAPDVRLKSSGGIALPSSNPEKLALKITPATGEFSGSFARLVSGKPVAPAASFFGVIVTRMNEGRGHFNLALAPDSNQPDASKTDILSGSTKLSRRP